MPVAADATDPAHPLLAQPMRLGRLELRNRIVFPAHLTNAAVDGMPTAQHAAYYAARAAGGAALVITEEHAAGDDDRPYEKVIRGTDPAVVPGLRRLTEAVHAHGAAVLAQIGHNGGQASSLYSRTPVRAPSAVPDPMFREVPKPLSSSEIARVVEGFARTAGHCVDGGYDGVELQGSQASLIRQFLSPLTNHRDDVHGADPALFLVEVIAAVRAVLGPDRVLGVRLQGDEGLPGGLTAADAAAVATRIAGTVDYVSTAVGVATATLPLIEPPMGVPAGYASAVPSAVRAALRAAPAAAVPVIGVGRFTTPADVDAALASGSCDLVGVVRGQIADPAFASRALAGHPVRRCTGCNQECIARVGLNQRLGCVVNPRAGRESLVSSPSSIPVDPSRSSIPVDPSRSSIPVEPAPELPTAGSPSNPPTPASVPDPPSSPPSRVVRRRRRVLVVGGGPAGLAAALAAAHHGDVVDLVEASAVLGGQATVAASAPGRGELAHLVTDLARECREAGVRIDTDTPADADASAGVDLVVAAVGAAPALPTWARAVGTAVGAAPPLPGRARAVDTAPERPAGPSREHGPAIVDVADVLTGRAVPRGRVLVVDDVGGAAAPSVAELLARRGARVATLTSAMVAAGELGPTLELDRWTRRAAALGVEQWTDRVVLSATPAPDGRVALDVLHHPVDTVEHWSADAVVCVSPRRPRPLDLPDGPPVIRVGDALAPRGLAAAVREGHDAGGALHAV